MSTNSTVVSLQQHTNSTLDYARHSSPDFDMLKVVRLTNGLVSEWLDYSYDFDHWHSRHRAPVLDWFSKYDPKMHL